MKIALIAAATLGCLAPLGVAAQSAPPASAPAPKFSGNTPIETLVANPEAKAVLVQYNLLVDQHPAYDMFKQMSLRDVQPMSEGAITLELIAKIEEDLAKIK